MPNKFVLRRYKNHLCTLIINPKKQAELTTETSIRGFLLADVTENIDNGGQIIFCATLSYARIHPFMDGITPRNLDDFNRSKIPHIRINSKKICALKDQFRGSPIFGHFRLRQTLSKKDLTKLIFR
ncbi:MAG: hypothetical protein OEV93_03690 [Candidatus Moranbacteria bacterium]|nr:hypothetical protein [Candidatus Moranbacteria bacterium]